MKVFIFGIGPFAEQVTYFIRKYTHWEICAYVVDAEYKQGDVFLGIPLLDTKKAVCCYPPERAAVVLALGFREMCQVRAQKYEFFKKLGYSFPNLIHPSDVIEDCKMGEGNILLAKVCIGPFSEIGNANVFNEGCILAHNNHIYDFNWFAPGVTTGGGVVVKSHVFAGLGAVIRSGKCVNHYSLIGAGCYIDRDTEEKKVYVPVRSICLEGKTCFDMHL